MTGEHEETEIELELPEVEFVMLANRAEVLDQMLYMMGGGIDTFFVGDFTAPYHLWVAVSVLIPWSAAGQVQMLRLFLEDADGRDVPPGYQQEIGANRPPGVVEGQSFRHLSAYLLSWVFPGVGSYRLTAVAGYTRPKQVAFGIRRWEDRPPQTRFQYASR